MPYAVKGTERPGRWELVGIGIRNRWKGMSVCELLNRIGNDHDHHPTLHEDTEKLALRILYALGPHTTPQERNIRCYLVRDFERLLQRPGLISILAEQSVYVVDKEASKDRNVIIFGCLVRRPCFVIEMISPPVVMSWI